MDELKQLLEQIAEDGLQSVIISKPRKKDGVFKIKVTPVLLKKETFYQAILFEGTKNFHQNMTLAECLDQMMKWMSEDFGQMEVESSRYQARVLVSKKGTVSIKNKQRAQAITIQPMPHNRKKKYLLEEGHPVPFLVDLGVMNSEGKIIHSKYDKFRQINRFLEFIQDILPRLSKEREVTILDFGCGKSYLTFAMYYFLRIIKGYDIRIIGLDLKEDVIEHCNACSKKYGYDKLQFYKGDVASYEGISQVDMVVTLHACDTATDYALEKAVKLGAEVILSVPCCQHELNGKIANQLLQPILQYGLLKERISALLTDGLRAEILKNMGYEVQILEFIDMEHTPKNILIRAIKSDKRKNNQKEIQEMEEFFNSRLTLSRLLMEYKE